MSLKLNQLLRAHKTHEDSLHSSDAQSISVQKRLWDTRVRAVLRLLLATSQAKFSHRNHIRKTVQGQILCI